MRARKNIFRTFAPEMEYNAKNDFKLMKPFRHFLGVALIIALPLLTTSCDDILGEWDRPTPQTEVPAAALGSAENPYQIATSADWDAFAAKVNGGESTIHAKLTADLSGVTTVIGTADNPFKGTFDGQGYKISAVDIAGESNVGLFGYVNDAAAVIQNVVVASGTVTASGQNVGAIVGHMKEGTIKYCANYAAVSSTYSSTESGARLGGIVGWMEGVSGGANTVTYCINLGDITASATNGGYAGGIVGSFGVHSSGAGDAVTYCQNYGKITTSYGYGIGGIAGFLYATTSDPFTLANNHNGGNLVNSAASSNFNNVIFGGNNITGASAAASNSYLSTMTVQLATAAATAPADGQVKGATKVTSNPAGITIGSKTYTKE